MTIISCPECGKKISNLAPLCLHCGVQRGAISDEKQLVYKQRLMREKIYRLNMISYAVMTVLLAAFAWYWWASGGFQQRSGSGPFILMGLSAVAYLLVRGLLFRARRKQQQLKRVKI